MASKNNPTADAALISRELNFSLDRIQAVLQLFADGATIPFVARYRKEVSGGMDELALAHILKAKERLQELRSRRAFILERINAQGLLLPSLNKEINQAKTLADLEDLYLPYKVKRQTRASKAKALGLLPLADIIWQQPRFDWQKKIKPHIPEGLSNSDAVQGALDILAERISEHPWVRSRIRSDFLRHASVKSVVLKKKKSEAGQFSDYFDFEEKLSRCPSHRYLAINRGEHLGYLKVTLNLDHDRVLQPIRRELIKPGRSTGRVLKDVILDSYVRLLRPSIENDVRKHYKELADKTAIEIFGNNLRQLLLEAPLGEKRILAIDPGFRTGCKMVALDRHGQLLAHQTIFPHPPQAQADHAGEVIKFFAQKYRIEAIAIGNGTAGRETLELLQKILTDQEVPCYYISESGASIYSASDIARDEFPDLDLTYRGAISIGRRLMDPLAELIKLDPKAIGVGQYQHDVNQRALQAELDRIVASCVNAVGIRLNTASPQLLAYISGLGPTLASRIVEHRNRMGPFRRRSELLAIKGLGARAFQQSAGFLRIKNGDDPFDNTGIHPEAYTIARQVCDAIGISAKDLRRNSAQLRSLKPAKFVNEKFGLPTVTDILLELQKPGLDPRGAAEPVHFDLNIRSMDDLRIGCTLYGTVNNITPFGAFIYLGIKENGLIHKSELGGKNLDPMTLLHLQQQVKVEVIGLDHERKRIQLRLLN